MKKFDEKINYTEDIFSHIFSLLYLKKKQNLIDFSSYNIKKNIEFLEFIHDNLKISIKCSKNLNLNSKRVTFIKKKKVISEIVIKSKYFLVRDFNENNNFKFKNNSDNLVKQYQYILEHDDTKEFKNVCNKLIIYQNELHKLCKKFQ
jgi:hypothetical protein